MAALEDWIGREERRGDRVTGGLLHRFRATIGNPPEPAVPLGLHWCLCTPDTPMADLQEDGHQRLGTFLPPIGLPRRMWAGSAIRFFAPIAASAVIERVSTVASVAEKTGKSGALVFVEIDHLIRADGIDAVQERQTLVYRETGTAPISLPVTGTADLSDWPVCRSLIPDEALLFRYSALTFNTHRIHYDLGYVRDVEGYPGLVVHGPLIATLLLDLATREIGAEAIGAFSFRATSPAFAGQPLHLVAREADTGLALAALGDDGRFVMEAGATPR
ncbi:FAS1-like dehydratase domain-containing protein [Parasphingopyxis marina]|uniref:MaoC family dehydratase N-terminal domain-containing protein n=1 Tax=Parasphingopyxis marina TaxID=2761622 RepID=A0A842HU32_9SPHN|nr:MaoC family dehydratase N-terminal domain-containing protein [Parasphingopyxis marina]MBC2776043.1 MaoC family dehydratase N-terminal domain-containing protein [Parasphingopyxis marina]